MPLDLTISQLKNLVQTRIESLIDRNHPASLYEPMRYALAQPGKQLRPILLLLSCEAAGGDRNLALDAAVAIEVVHNFTLVHDDIMDHDELRRGRQTVYRRWDDNVAILTGDALLVLGYQLLSQSKPEYLPALLHIFSKAIMEICEGQALDKEFENRTAISLENYFEMIEKKTGRLFELACEAGAVIGNGTPSTVASLKSYGAVLGRAFQLQDDLLDVLGDEKTIGKDVGSDLVEDKKTFLMAHARLHADQRQLEMLEKWCAKRPLTPYHIEQIIALFKEIGTLSAAKDEINRCFTQARNMLNALPPTSASAYLSMLIDKMSTRSF